MNIQAPIPASFHLGRAEFIADISGALWQERLRTLIVADLHFEKASAFAAWGQFLPPYDTAATLARLLRLVGQYRPARLICLGDSFHDNQALNRMAASDIAQIEALSRDLELTWISGNHDPDMPTSLPGSHVGEERLDGVILRHEPGKYEPGEDGVIGFEIGGHLHPVALVVTPRGKLRRRCFASNQHRLILPAFGALAGGLNIRNPVFSGLFPAGDMIAHVLGSTQVYPIGPANLCSD